MKYLHAEVEIDAPAERVWQIVSDFGRYADWNPFIVRATGEPRVGERLAITIAAPGMKPVGLRPRVLDFEPGRLIRWKGEFKLPGLFDGRHALIVEPLSDGRSRFTTHEDVSGILLPFVGKVMTASQQGFELMARALKERAEA
ncbi:MAG: SRPBCC domain-containing protein [Actinobacteria bacterium]|nr:SRPBCC domain-containing protein [Actinomycetota bacterium]